MLPARDAVDGFRYFGYSFDTVQEIAQDFRFAPVLGIVLGRVKIGGCGAVEKGLKDKHWAKKF